MIKFIKIKCEKVRQLEGAARVKRDSKLRPSTVEIYFSRSEQLNRQFQFMNPFDIG